MAKLFIEESTLTNIGDAIRNKTGKSELLSPASMATEIESIQTGGGEIPELVLTGGCDHACKNEAWNPLFPYVRTENINSASNMFYGNPVERIPFDINFSSTGSVTLTNAFANVSLKTLPKMSPCEAYGAKGLFIYSSYLNDDIDSKMSFTSVYDKGDYSSMYRGCYSLRKAPMNLINVINQGFNYTSYSYYPSQYQFMECYSLDEIKGYYPCAAVPTSARNVFTSTLDNCSRLKGFTFALDENGAPYARNWKSVTLDFTVNCGYGFNYNMMNVYSKEFPADLEMKDSTTYAALKDNPNSWANNMAYSRYNHDSAVETINSLPDVSGGSSNTIKFRGAAGSGTDGGAINTLTEAEIAVATAKGWTVTLV